MGLELVDDNAPSSWAMIQIGALENLARMLRPLSLGGLSGAPAREAVAACNVEIHQAHVAVASAIRAIVKMTVTLAMVDKRTAYKHAEENVVLRARVLAGFLGRSDAPPPRDVVSDLKNAVDKLRALERKGPRA